jgi:hypothetical protein
MRRCRCIEVSKWNNDHYVVGELYSYDCVEGQINYYLVFYDDRYYRAFKPEFFNLWFVDDVSEERDKRLDYLIGN